MYTYQSLCTSTLQEGQERDSEKRKSWVEIREMVLSRATAAAMAAAASLVAVCLSPVAGRLSDGHATLAMTLAVDCRRRQRSKLI